ncbi:MAG: hypothetical protein J0I06_22925 [Planctomycetes bacterium]|nr:hypothetical protein [Planctomycetota bacterium]
MSGSDPAPNGITVRRIRFASHSVTSGRVCGTFKHPRLCLAVEEPVAPTDVKPAAAPDELFVALAPSAAEAEGKAVERDWFPDPSAPDAVDLDTSWRGGRVRWRPGFAVVFLRGARPNEVLAALAEFAFYEGELRRLEEEMNTREAPAAEDVARAYTIRRRDKDHWPRFADTTAAFARMRLTFARLSPRLAEEPEGSRSRRLASRLLRRARAASRAEALDTRLEACEDLYEGANDRVADHQGWHQGHVLEIIIVALLLLEVILLCAELVVRGGE